MNGVLGDRHSKHRLRKSLVNLRNHERFLVKSSSLVSQFALQTGLRKPATPKHKAKETCSTGKIHKFLNTKKIKTKNKLLFKKKPSDELYKRHLHSTFQGIAVIKGLRAPSHDEIKRKLVNLPRKKGLLNKKTVVFDLDETLIHCSEKSSGNYIKIPLSNEGEVVMGVNIRPFAKEVLSSARNDYEVLVFTASHKAYADRVLDLLDPSHELIHHRLYRDSCILVDGVHIKDLRILANRSLKDIVIVDNTVQSFAFQLDNGVPIISWYDDVHDRELYKLIHYLKSLAKSKDLRALNRQTFKLHSFYEDYMAEFIGVNKENQQ